MWSRKLLEVDDKLILPKNSITVFDICLFIFYFRCIKSNGEKVPHVFDDETVQRQLRYTGMLETVRIRQAGYNVRLTYEEFIQLYRILLPKGLLSSQADVRHFLATLNLDRDNYQLGK